MAPTKSKNCVARTIVYGMLEALMRFSCASLRAEVAAGEEAIGADDGEGDVVADAGGSFGGVDIAAGGFEEVEHGLVFEGRGVRDIDDDGRAGESIGEAFAGERVDARGTGSGQDLVAVSRRILTSLVPMRPLPPMTTIFMGGTRGLGVGGAGSPGIANWAATNPRVEIPVRF